MKTNNEIFTITAKTVSGLEQVLRDELEMLGASDLVLLKRAVSFSGEKSLLYRVNYCSRLALRILKPMMTFEIREQKDLYEKLMETSWEDLVDPENTIAVDAVISDSVFTNSQFVAMRTKDAIVDRIRNHKGKRPSVDLDNPDLRINVHLNKQTCTVSLDSSGRSLHKRGYRISAGLAPINEVLASGLIHLSGWDKKTPFLDPMCGSGTLLIEAAAMRDHIPPGYFKPEFGFMKWKDFDPGLWNQVKEKEDAQIVDAGSSISGCDISQRAVNSVIKNITLANLRDRIKVELSSFENYAPSEAKGLIITNPPYDERLPMDDIISFYQMIGNVLKRKYTGYQAWIISSDMRALKFIGLHPSKRITVFNGPLECRFVRFDLY